MRRRHDNGFLFSMSAVGGWGMGDISVYNKDAFFSSTDIYRSIRNRRRKWKNIRTFHVSNVNRRRRRTWRKKPYSNIIKFLYRALPYCCTRQYNKIILRCDTTGRRGQPGNGSACTAAGPPLRLVPMRPFIQSSGTTFLLDTYRR